MIKTYVINLDRNPERLNAMRVQFNNIRVPFERFPAVDGRDIAAEQFDQFVRARPLLRSGDLFSMGRRQWTRGSMGCFMSHFALWSAAAASADRFTAIFEDDIHMSSSVKAFLETDSWIPSECDLIRLEESFNRVKLQVGTRKVEGRSIRIILPSLFEQSWPVCTGAYIIAKDTARRLVNVPIANHAYADIFMFNRRESSVACNLSVGQIDPAICVQDKYLYKDSRDIVHRSSIDIGLPKDISRVRHIVGKIQSLGQILAGHRRIRYNP